MSAGFLFIVVVLACTILGSRAGVTGAIGGFIIGVLLWLLGGLFWLVSTGYVCAEERSDNPYDVSEKCDY